MYSFLIAAVTNYHKLSGLKVCSLLSCLSGGQSEMGLTGLKSRCRQGCIPFRGSRGELISLLFQLLGVTCTPWLVAPSSIFNVGNGWLSLSYAASL